MYILLLGKWLGIYDLWSWLGEWVSDHLSLMRMTPKMPFMNGRRAWGQTCGRHTKGGVTLYLLR